MSSVNPRLIQRSHKQGWQVVSDKHQQVPSGGVDFGLDLHLITFVVGVLVLWR